MALGLIAASVITAWTLTFSIPATVPAASALADVAFGWPLPWYHQDLSRFTYTDFPVDVTVVGDRVSPVPTDVAWMPFAANVVILGAVWGVLGALAIRGLAGVSARSRRGTGAAEA